MLKRSAKFIAKYILAGVLPSAILSVLVAKLENAIMDALQTVGVGHIDMPLTPSRVWHALQSAKRN